MTKHKKHEAIESEDLGEIKLLGTTKIQDAVGNIYGFRLWAHSTGIPRYQVQISIEDQSSSDEEPSAPNEEPSFWVDPRSLQKLTAWFAKTVLRVNKYEDYVPMKF